MSDDETNFLVQAIDPFHDVQRPRVGLPDGQPSRTITKCVTVQRQISAPIDTAGTWSAVIFTSPLDIATKTSYAYTTEGNIYPVDYSGGTTPWSEGSVTKATTLSTRAPPTGIVNGIGPLNVHLFNTDVPTFFPNGQGGNSQDNWVPPVETITVDVYDDPVVNAANTATVSRYNAMPYRILGSGYELRNTTAQLYKQGTLTQCRVGNSVDDESYTVAQKFGAPTKSVVAPVPNAPNTYIKQQSREKVSTFALPPVNTTVAMRNGDTVVRNAADGIYAVNRYDMSKNRLVADNRGYFYAKSSEVVTQWTEANDINSSSYCTGFAYPPATTAYLSSSGLPGNGPMAFAFNSNPTPLHFSPRDICCTYLTGLSQQSTFTLTAKFYIEMMPRSIDPEFAALTELKIPAPFFSTKALQLYSHVAHELPPCVNVDQNPSGEFWSQVVKGVTGLAGSLLAAAAPEMAIPAALLAQGGLFASKLIGSAKVAKTDSKIAGQIGGIKSALMADHVIKSNHLHPDKKKKKKKKKVPASRPSSTSSRARLRVRIA